MDEQMNAADKGPEGEKRFREWLAQNKLGFVPICQQKETFATLFFGAVKRPDFLVLIDSIGIIAVDTKYKKPTENGFTLSVAKGIREAITFESVFRIPF